MIEELRIDFNLLSMVLVQNKKGSYCQAEVLGATILYSMISNATFNDGLSYVM